MFILAARVHKVVSVENDAWHETGAAELNVRIRDAVKPTEKVRQTLAQPDDEMPSTYLFETRKGGRGILQVIGYGEESKEIELRYKLVRELEEASEDQATEAVPGDEAPCGAMANAASDGGSHAASH